MRARPSKKKRRPGARPAARDPFALDLIKNALASAADEMALTIARTARSFVVREALDFSTALFLPGGELIAQGTCLPFHLGAMPFAVSSVMTSFAGDIHPGDLFMTNDPYDGSTHLPDIVLVKPVFADAIQIGWVAALAHMTDIGGRVAGGNASDSTEVYQEGLRLPPCKLWRAGVQQESLVRIIERNVRVPEKVIGDLRALISACIIGERELHRLASRYGVEEFFEYCLELLNFTERATRAEIAKLPKGTWTFVDYIDSDGIDPDPIRFVATVTIRSDDMTIDFTGTAPQVRGAINCVYPFTRSTALACVRSIIDLSIPNNSGYFRPIEVIAPEGTIVNPRPPAAVAARGLTGIRIADTVFGALAQALPDLIPACGSNLPEVGISFGSTDESGRADVYLEFLLASWGGGPDRDGMDACTGLMVNYSNTPAEMIEADLPLAIKRYAFIPDSGGPGLFRGGLAIERHVQFKTRRATLQIRSDRRDHPPYGRNGGSAGSPSNVTIARASGSEELCPAKFLTTVHAGDVLKVRLAGAGGYGAPYQRDPAAVLDDIADEKISLDHARQAYGVILHAGTSRIDEEATASMRTVLSQTKSSSRSSE
jgi:N-methylhydantoinase B